MIKIIWPLLVFIVLQFTWNIVAVFFHGNFDSKIGDWIYSRNCNWSTACDGGAFLWWIWLGIALLFVINLVFQIVRRKN